MIDDLRHLARELSSCLITDRYRIARRLRELREAAASGLTLPSGVVAGVARQVDDALHRARLRVARLPTTSYPPELPVSQRRDEIIAAIRGSQVVVVCGETGSGKTTQLPKICLDAGRGRTGLIGHTQPRRIAARSVAQRIADELEVPLGREVGYKVRFGDKTSPDTVIKLMTDGMLLTETQHDRPLAYYDTIIIDEAHERSLNIDFLLGYLKQLLPKRPDLKVVITSATIDPQRLSKHFFDAPIIEVSGRTFPVEIRYRPLTRDGSPGDHSSPDDDLRAEDGLVRALDEIHRETGPGSGDVLVFLPGEREIRNTAGHLADHFPRGVEVVPLFAKLSNAEQQRIFQSTPHPSIRRVVLSTNIAETSLTVPGIRYVIDAGEARISRYSPTTKVQRLPIEAVSKASANQRSGRCGRLGPGIAYRLYSLADFQARPDFTDPEVLRTNLASVILQMKALRLGRVEDFPFIDPPDGRLVRDGYDTLRELGAINDDGDLMPIGVKLAKLPIDPRLGRMILAAADENCVAESLVITAALSVEDPRERPMEMADKADKAHEQFEDPESDFIGLLNLWNAYHEVEAKATGGALRRWCRQNFISFIRVREWSSTHAQLTSLARAIHLHPASSKAPRENIHRAILAGLLGSIGVKNDKGSYDGCRGVKFSIFPGSGLFRKGPGHVMAAELIQTTKLYAHDVARVQPEWIESVGKHLVKRQYQEPHYDDQHQQVYAYERVTLFGLEIVSRRRVHYGPIDPAIARELFIQNALVERLYVSPAPFWTHNNELLAELRTVSHKARRSDLAVDPQLVFDFYDKRLGPGVFSGASLDLWRKTAERANPKVLFMSKADLTPPDAAAVTHELYPDRIETFGTKLSLQYAFDPGKDHDGLTVPVPLESLHQVDEERLEWLVPGMVASKVQAVLEALPKVTRQRFDDPAALAPRLAAAMPFGKGSFIDSLAKACRDVAKVDVPRDAWRTSSLPGFLRATIRVLDDKGHELASDKSLRSLLERFGQQARDKFIAAAGQQYTKGKIVDWNFGDLPERVNLGRGASSLSGYPAIVDRITSVELQVVESPHHAAQLSRPGIRRLYMFAAKDELDWALRVLPETGRLFALYSSMGSPQELRDEVAAVIADRVFMPGPGDSLGLPRTRDAFVARLRGRWDAVRDTAREIGETVSQILVGHQALQLRLAQPHRSSWDAAVRDAKLHSLLLIHKGSLAAMPWEQLRQVPRYLSAGIKRFEKLVSHGPARDARSMDEMRDVWTAYLRRVDARNKTGRPDPQLDTLKWMLEELRVSLFAQELGTASPISVKRVQAHIDEHTLATTTR